jgi:uncharacterized membrane protein
VTRNVLGGLLGLILFFYPVLVFFGMDRLGNFFLPGLMALVFLLRWLFLPALKNNVFLPFVRLITLAGLLLCLTVLLRRDADGMLWYPVMVSVIGLIFFAYTLVFPPSLIERFARVMTPELPPQAIAYTKHVTQVWCGFFIANGLVATYTIMMGNKALWVLYNGFISYVIVGCLLAGEWLLRRYLQRRWHQA